jgi:hypothetical protein
VKLFGWTTGSSGLDRIRVTLPMEEMAKHGHEVYSGHTFLREYGDSDTIVGCRISLPDPSRLWTHACGMYGGPFMVFETDDDNLRINKWNNLRPSKDMPSAYEFWSNAEIRRNYVANMRVAHRIVTSTPYLAQLLYEDTGHPDIVVAPNAVPGWMLEPEPQPVQDVVVGWAGGASHWGDWEWAKGGIRRGLVKAQVKELRLVGQDFRKLVKFERMSHVPWFPTVDDYWREGLVGFHIGLAPLRPEPFNRSKSPIRLIEYGARGIPVIAQDYGPYADFVEDGVTGFLVKTPKDWTEAIIELAGDPELRQSMSKAARRQAHAHTIEALWPKYKEAYTP